MTDAEKPSESLTASSDPKDLSIYSAQLIVTVALEKVSFRSDSYKEMVQKCKSLNVKSRGIGKYELANRMAKKLIENNYIAVSDNANYIALRREDFKINNDIMATSTVSSQADTLAEDTDDSQEFRNEQRNLTTLKKIVLHEDDDDETQDFSDNDDTQDILY